MASASGSPEFGADIAETTDMATYVGVPVEELPRTGAALAFDILRIAVVIAMAGILFAWFGRRRREDDLQPVS